MHGKNVVYNLSYVDFTSESKHGSHVSLPEIIQLLEKNISQRSIDTENMYNSSQYTAKYKELIERLKSVSEGSLIKRIPPKESFSSISNNQYSMF